MTLAQYSRSKNEGVIAPGMSNDGRIYVSIFYLYSRDHTVQTSICEIVQNLDKNAVYTIVHWLYVRNDLVPLLSKFLLLLLFLFLLLLFHIKRKTLPNLDNEYVVRYGLWSAS